MNLVLVLAFFAAMILTRATSKPEAAAPEAFDQRREHDARFYQNAVINQERRLEGLDATLTSTGILWFGAMTYLLTTDAVRDGFAARFIAIAMLFPIGFTVIGVLGSRSYEAPDLRRFAAAAEVERSHAYDQAQEALLAAFAANRADVAAKVLYRNWAYGLGRFS